MVVSGTFSQMPSSKGIKKLEESFVDLYLAPDNELTAVGQSSKYPPYTMQSSEEGIHLSTVDYMFMSKKPNNFTAF